jgi:hypothetical protein
MSQRAVNTGGAVMTSSVSSPLADHLHGGGERVEALAQLRQAGARGLGQLHAAPGAAEQLHAEEFLQALDLVADRRLRDGELVRRFLERQMARGRFEHAQGIEGRQAVDHVGKEELSLMGNVEFYSCHR